MSQTHNPTGMRAGGIKAPNITAVNVVTGVQIQGGDAETARSLLALTQDMESGGVEATQALIAQNLVTGLQYVGKGDTTPSIEQFQQELLALREQLAQAVQAGEFTKKYAAEDTQRALDRAIEQSKEATPDATTITDQLKTAATIINDTAKTAESVGKLGALVIKLAPVATALYKMVGMFF